MPSSELKSFYAKNRKAWRKWLEKNHLKEEGVWLIYYKKGSGKTRVSWEQAVEEALCFGWIDSISKPIDEEKYKQKFTPRKLTSVWSAINKKKIESLVEQGLMMPAGLKIIDAAKQNGSWIKLDSVENFEIPPELKKILERNKKVAAHFEQLSKFRRKQWLYRINNAKLPETKKKRLEELREEAKLNKKIFSKKQKGS